jgi:hypothetical protein
VFIDESLDLTVGDMVELYQADDEKTIWYGIIVRDYQTDRNFITFTGYDRGFYLEKNEITIQFRDAKISDAIEQVCQRINIEAQNIPVIETTIRRIYNKTKVSDILKDLLKVAKEKGLGEDYFYSLKFGKLELLSYTENNSIRGYIADFYSIESFKYIKGFNKSESIENLKNSIELYRQNTSNKSKDEEVKILSVQQQDSMDAYGYLNYIEEIDADTNKTEKEYFELAKSKLQELNKVTKSLSFEVFADYNLQTGIYTNITSIPIQVDDTYVVTKSDHTISSNIESVKVDVEKYKNE